MQSSGAAAASAAQIASRSAIIPFALIVTLFFLWGLANNLNDILITQFKKAFTLSDFQAGLVQSAFYLGYFLLALPAAIFMRHRGYKGAVALGLVLYACGAFLFWPAAQLHTYGLFLLALFAIVNVVLCAVAVAMPGHLGAYALVASSFFMSVMFPTIFALGIDGLGDDERKLGSALIVMAIIGGAFLPAVMGATSDLGGIHVAMSLPLVCFAVVLAFATLSAARARQTALET